MVIGTSGWSYDDWAGTFYPPELRKEKWLAYYARFFRTVEVNSTYYSFPSPAMIAGWVAKASGIPGGFEYSMKFPRRVTHDSLLSDIRHALEFEHKVLGPLREAGMLGGVLIQTSPYFRLIDKGKGTDHLERLKALLESLDTERFEYVIEFRHSSWVRGGRLDSSAADLLRTHGVGVCAVDGPSMPPIVESTTRHVYIRLHGRNTDIWYDKDRDMSGRMNRYDYLYREPELSPWKVRINSVYSAARTVRVYFNNHPHANAVRNAKLFESMLGIKSEKEELPSVGQSNLSSFFGPHSV